MKFKYVIYYLIKFILRNYMNFIIHDKKLKNNIHQYMFSL